MIEDPVEQLRRHYQQARRRERAELWMRRLGILFALCWWAAVLGIGFYLGRCTAHP
jgi:hypothetical protein